MVEPSGISDPNGRVTFEMLAEVIQLLDKYRYQLPADTEHRLSAYAHTITALQDLVAAYEGYAPAGSHRNKHEAIENMHELLGGTDTARDLIMQLERLWSHE